ncbi:hypothetical protein P3T73_18030 [Kiritimatiellota bacterium B12222]|nr:hypothetical protein P3T73_18030 [Kiritimatiellota bacterium B12222]
MYSRAWGKLTADELTDHVHAINTLFAQEEINSDWAQIFDCSEVTAVAKNPSNLIRNLVLNNPWPAEAARAIISNSPLTFGFSRMYQMLGGESLRHLKVVHTLEEAETHIEQLRRESLQSTEPCIDSHKKVPE